MFLPLSLFHSSCAFFLYVLVYCHFSVCLPKPVSENVFYNCLSCLCFDLLAEFLFDMYSGGTQFESKLRYPLTRVACNLASNLGNKFLTEPCWLPSTCIPIHNPLIFLPFRFVVLTSSTCSQQVSRLFIFT
jgi:hypothetical protein